MVLKENQDFEFSVILSSLWARIVSNLMRMMDPMDKFHKNAEVKKLSVFLPTLERQIGY